MTEATGAQPQPVTLNAPFRLRSVRAATAESLHTEAWPAFASVESASPVSIFAWLVREQQMIADLCAG